MGGHHPARGDDGNDPQYRQAPDPSNGIAAIVFSIIALGGFAAFADSNTNSANKKTEATEAPAAAGNTQTEDSVAKKCVDILAHKADHTAAELTACQK